MKKNGLPRLSLPVVCGYIPLAKLLTKSLEAPTPAPTRNPSKIADVEREENENDEYDDIDNDKKEKKRKEKEEKEEKKKKEEKKEDIKSIKTKKPITVITEKSLREFMEWK